jgi:serine/threonine protein kinase
MSLGADSRTSVVSAERPPAALAALADDYELGRELGRGGTAVVYLARERSTDVEVAIKLIRAQFADDDEASARLAREARFVAQLTHPNVVPVRAVLDLGEAGLALVMEHVQGRTLKEILRHEGALAPTVVEGVMRDLAGALCAAHDVGIVHRDVKPENVFVDDTGRALLADFGIARSMSSEAQQLTMSGVAIGTPTYMAPEQIDGVELDGRADIYSLGLVGWEMLTGHRPWAGEALYSVLYHQKHVQLTDVSAMRPDVPDTLASAIAGAIEKDRDSRWPDALSLVAALDGDVPLRPWPAAATAPTSTVRIDRASIPAAAESVVAIDWRDFADSAPPLAVAPAPRFSRRRLALGSGLSGIVALALVVSAVRTHSRSGSAEAPPPSSTALPSARQAGTALASAAQERFVAGEVTDRATTAARMDGMADSTSLRADSPAAVLLRSPGRQAGPIAAAAAAVAAPIIATPAVARTRVAAGGRHSCLLAEDGRAFCWGGNDRGQLGTNSTTRLGAPLAEAGSMHFVAIASGMSHSCALAADETAWCWGDNDSGQLGDGTTIGRPTPTPVSGGRGFRDVAAGSAHSCALATDGTAWCWGDDSSGQLGDGAMADRDTPGRVAGGHRFASIAAGWRFTCALDSGGRAWCWGENAAGQLGDSSRVRRDVPTMVRGAPRFVGIAAGSSHACGVTASGSAWCWGGNSNGQLGDGSALARSTPVRVASDERFVGITAGAVHSCAVTAAGEARCWGRNTYGQIGDGTNDDRLVPTRVVGGHDFTSVRAFGSHSCGVTRSGETFCWGYNLDGQLGDGTRTHRSRPVYVERPSGP